MIVVVIIAAIILETRPPLILRRGGLQMLPYWLARCNMDSPASVPAHPSIDPMSWKRRQALTSLRHSAEKVENCDAKTGGRLGRAESVSWNCQLMCTFGRHL